MTVAEDLITRRLQIHPLNDTEMSSLMNGMDNLEMKLGITVSSEEPNPDLHMTVEWLALQMVVHSNEFPWWTVWHIRLREEQRSVGCLCFKGAPDDAGGVEIDYAFVYPRYYEQGMMTEAAGAVTDWALQQNGVDYVMAEIENWNEPAQRVLEKNGYQCYNEAGNSKFYWKRKTRSQQ